MGSGCGAVGREVASDTSGPQFESSHRQSFYRAFVYCQLYRKDENKEKEAENGPFLKRLPMTGFEPSTPFLESNRSSNCATTTTAQIENYSNYVNVP